MQSRIGQESRLVTAIQVIVGGHVFAAGLATYFGNETWYERYLMPALLRLTSPETGHRLAVKAAHYGLMPRIKHACHPELKCRLWNLNFGSPIGLAAGFDKHGEAVDGMLRLGFGFVEVGTVTPEPQEGNGRPRVFRLTEDKAVINRYGFNSDGSKVVHDRLKVRDKQSYGCEVPDDRNMLNEQLWSPDRPKFRGQRFKEAGVVGVNIGKNKTSSDAAEDYVHGVNTFGDVADYIVINVSSPNTTGLRDLQQKHELEKLIQKVVATRNKLAGKKIPLLVKIAPDLSMQQKEDIAAVVSKKGCGVDGLIVCNTTVSRPSSLKSAERDETGGLSGAPLKQLATDTVRDIYRLTKGQIPIIGVGGVSSGQDAYDKIKSGASLVQLYTSMVYAGPVVVSRINNDLAELLRRDGYKNVLEAVGADMKKTS